MFETAKLQLLAAYQSESAAEPPDSVERRRRRFLEEFAPKRLSELRGQDLLRFVHGDGSSKGLFYELEFGPLGDGLGSVAGGSSLKFKVWRGQDGQWKRKGKGNYPVSTTEEDALEITAELVNHLTLGLRHADQLDLARGEREAWLHFQREVEAQTPALRDDEGYNQPTLNLGWGHKYLAIVRPDLFSFHHRSKHLARHLVRLGLEPVEGRYLRDWQWRLVRLGDTDLSGLNPVLLMRAAYSDAGFGPDPTHWRVGTTDGDEDRWPAMRAGSFISIGWPELGDLTDLLAGITGDAARQRLKEALEPFGKHPAEIGNYATEVYNFLFEMHRGGRVVAMRGETVLGIGLVEGEYSFVSGGGQPHHRPVRWLLDDSWVWKGAPGLRRSVYDFTDRYQDTLRIERLVTEVGPAPRVLPPLPPAVPLSALEVRIRDTLTRKGQAILYGPPGTGKTYHARRASQEIISRKLFNDRSWSALSAAEKDAVDRMITFCTFHPSYSYEEFVEGYRPVPPEETGGVPAFRLQDGCFLEVCKRASSDPGCPHVLIIDEINRGNVAAILGELITLLEVDKRGVHQHDLAVSHRRFTVPRNVWIIGTMNTADRSISLLDAALWRRFGFIELLPKPETLGHVEELHLGDLLDELNRRIRQHVPRNARGLQIGHAYFIRDETPIRTREELLEVMRDDVIPLLEDYCFENYSVLADILSDEMVDGERQKLRDGVIEDPERMHRALAGLVFTSAGGGPRVTGEGDADEEPSAGDEGNAD